MAVLRWTVAAAILASTLASAAQDPPKQEDPGDPIVGPVSAGEVAVEGTTNGATIHFAEYRKSYDVQFSIPVLLADKGLDSSRFSAWLLAKGGKALRLREGPDKGVLPAVSTNGRSGTAVAMFDFDHEVETKDLVGIVVSVDGKLSVLAMPKLK